MDQSLTLLSAQVHFLDTNLSLIHIPLPLYHAFLQPILALLLPRQADETRQLDGDTLAPDTTRTRNPWAYQYPFVNVSVTPIECSVLCPTAVARHLFLPVRDALDAVSREQVSISSEEYVCIQVDGEGLDAGQRVLELSSPLALNGISIFFITTYFSDYILVPLKSRAAVTTALESRGFAFSSSSEAFVNIASPLMQPELGHPVARGSSSTVSTDPQDLHSSSYFSGIGARLQDQPPPCTPPPTSIAELQKRTFELLRKVNVSPTVDCTLRLVQCAGRKDTLRGGTGSHSSFATHMMRLQLGLVKSLIVSPRPRFLSVTLTDTEPASLLLEHDLLANFKGGADGAPDVLLGNVDDILVPITLDLRDLPMESTGIVCGIAGRLVGGTSGVSATGTESDDADDISNSAPVEMSYLSTARAGTVMVAERELERALGALQATDDTQQSTVDVVTEAVDIVKLNSQVASDW